MSLGSLFRGLLGQRSADAHVTRAVDDELAFHIETRVQRLTSEGMAPEAARAEAMRQFGDLPSVRDDCVEMDLQKERSMNRSDMVAQIAEDLNYASRSLRKAWGMTSIAVVTIAFAIAALTTVFSILNTGYFRPLPFAEADRLVGLNATIPKQRYYFWNSAPLAVVNAIRHDAKSFERVAAYQGWTGFVLSDKIGAAQVWATHVDTALFGLLGTQVQRGRLFTDDEIHSAAPVALISDSLWRTRYNRDESILGSQIRLDDNSHTIVGVLEPGFRFNNTSDVWVPLVEHADSVAASKATWYWLAARRKNGVSLTQAREEMAQIARNLASNNPAEFKGLSLAVKGSIINRANPAYFTLVGLFVLVSLAVFLIACTNVANLLLVRAAERRGEMAVRATLGASRARLIRQSLAESALIATAAGLLGAALSAASLKLLLASVPTQGFPSWMRFGFDFRVFAFVTACSAVAVLAFGLVPARHGTRVNLVDALKSTSDVVVSDRTVSHRGRRGAVVQIALSMSLLVVAFFFARSYFFLARLDRGYDAESVLVGHVVFNRAKYTDPASNVAAYTRVMDKIAADGRVEGAALAGYLVQLRPAAGADPKAPLPDSIADYDLYIPGRSDAALNRAMRPSGKRLAVTDDYFRLMRIPIVRGRVFETGDVPGGQHVAIVSQRIATALWPADNPLGKTFQLGATGPAFVVVGVAGDVRDPTDDFTGGSTAPWPNVYFPARQVTYWPEMYFRPRAPIAAAQSLEESAIRDLDPTAMAWPLKNMASYDGSQRETETLGLAVGAMAASGTFLALLGVYGVIAYGVTRRTREIGLRIALGATQDQVVGMFAQQGLRLTGIGLAVGLVLAVGVARLTTRFVWGVSLLDPTTYIASAMVFGGVAMFACWLAARRATRVEPREALRTL